MANKIPRDFERIEAHLGRIDDRLSSIEVNLTGRVSVLEGTTTTVVGRINAERRAAWKEPSFILNIVVGLFILANMLWTKGVDTNVELIRADQQARQKLDAQDTITRVATTTEIKADVRAMKTEIDAIREKTDAFKNMILQRIAASEERRR